MKTNFLLLETSMLQLTIENKGLDAKILSKSEAIKIHKEWLCKFARKTKDLTGKWKIGDYLWEAFNSDIQPAITNAKAIERYKIQRIEPVYIFDESGKCCFYCDLNEYPEFYNSGLDVYIFPESKSWTLVFAHDNAVYFVEEN